MSKTLYMSRKIESLEMRFRSRRSYNGVLVGLIAVLVTLLILGITTGMIIFYILMGVVLLFSLIGVIGLFTFLKKTGQTSSPTRRSTYDITKGKSYVDNDSLPEKAHETTFCESCGMKLEAGMKYCKNCRKTSK